MLVFQYQPTPTSKTRIINDAIKVYKNAEELDTLRVSSEFNDDVSQLGKHFKVSAAYFEGGNLLVDAYSYAERQQKLYNFTDEVSSRFDVTRILVLAGEQWKREWRGAEQIEEVSRELTEAESLNQFKKIMLAAYRQKAQEVYIRLSADENVAFANFKVDEELTESRISLDDYDLGMQIVSAIYNGQEGLGEQSGGLDEFTTPQEKQIEYLLHDEKGKYLSKYDIRFTKTKTSKMGELFVNMRLFPLDAPLTLDQLTLNDTLKKSIHVAVKKESGVILTCGPTGSGKSTLNTAIMLDYPKTKLIHEYGQPLERRIGTEYYNIVQNSLEQDQSYKGQLRASMRQSPDGFLVQEIRDEETADFVMYLAGTGHFVLSTVHAPDVLGIIPRLHKSLKVPLQDLATENTLNLLISQRLVKTLCGSCAQEYADVRYQRKQEIEELSELLPNVDMTKIQYRKRGGCIACSNTGEAERLLVTEHVQVQERDRQFIGKYELREWREYLEKERGFVSLQDSVLELTLQGRVAPERLVSVLNVK